MKPSAVDVSRETREKLELLERELRRWQEIKNLVGPATLDRIWDRHIVDSLQLLDLAPEARTWLDLGSGAGFPGLVLAIAGAERGLRVHLVESNSRKCAFLRHVVRLAGAPAIGLFPKGRDAEIELTAARKRWTFAADILPSRTDSEARILRITSIESHS
jgi:16S rRNA (guanine527-N7)-methyltransferase